MSIISEDDNRITRLHQALDREETSSKKLTQKYFDRIEDKDEKLNAFLTLTKGLADKKAEKVDQKRKGKERLGPLEGIPVAVKDNILIEGSRCTAGSKILENYKACYDAHAVSNLKEEGAVILGKTNLDEFAMGSSTENSAFGATKNPHDLDRVPGGSSGGSAAAVASGEVAYALGSDTGGSVRQPASLCGVVGLKPTYGTVSRRGLIAMASSLDVIGSFTNTVEGAEIVFDAMSGKDPLDSTSTDPKSGYDFVDKDKLIIGIPKEYYQEGLNEEVETRLNDLQQDLQGQSLKGRELTLKEVSLPHTEYALACYYIIMPSEVSANLARYDGFRYGGGNLEESEKLDLKKLYQKKRSRGFGKEVQRRIMLGTFSLSSGYYDDYYGKAQKVRSLIKRDFKRVFNDVDCLLTPTTPSTSFKLGSKTDPLQLYLQDIYTVPANLAGIPAISIPLEKSSKELPVGGQLMAPQFAEELLFQLGRAVEKTV